MKRIIRLTETDLSRIIRRVIKEQDASAIGAMAGSMGQAKQGELSLTDCDTYITTKADSIREPIDPDMAGQGTVIKNVTITYNPTVSPNYRSITMSKNGVPFCSTKVG